MKLRDYQQQGHDAIGVYWALGARNVLYVLPTGGGKTVTFAHIVSEEPGASVVLAHRKELIAQISLALAREGVRHRIIGPDKLVKLCVKAHLRELGTSYYDANAKAGVGSVQSVKSYTDAAWFAQVRLWVHDEAHHLLTDNQFGKAVAKFPNARGLGVTATPGRADGKGLGRHAHGLMDVMVQGPTPRELINLGYLSEYKIFAPPSTLDRAAIHIAGDGDFNKQELRAATKNSTVLGDIVTHYCKRAMGRQGLTFADSIDNAVEIAVKFRAAGVNAEVLTGETDDAVRDRVIERFKAREIQQIVSVQLIDEGFDCPGVEVVSDGAATESFARFAQRFGRGLRIMPGKTHMVYLDHVGNTERHGLPDARREWTLDARERRSNGKNDAVPIRVCVGCFEPYERVLRVCPHCGHYPEPAQRSAPQFVDGDLMELDAAVLAALRGEIEHIDGAPVVPWGAAPEVQGAVRKRHAERQVAQAELRNAMQWWGGLQAAQGRDKSESERRFWFRFGIDVATAQTLGVTEARGLAERVCTVLRESGIDGTINARLYHVDV